MASEAGYSKFYFSRVFSRITGLSPARFHAALRISSARRLLLTTAMSVAEVGTHTGYSSPGTFCSRFKAAVGMTPKAFRTQGGLRPRPRQRSEGTGAAATWGKLTLAHRTEPGHIFLGVFPDRLAEGTPVAHTVLAGPGPFLLSAIPPGTWYLLGYPLPALSGPAARVPATDPAQRIGPVPLVLLPDRVQPPLTLQLRPIRLFDPPVLSAPFREPFVSAPLRENTQALPELLADRPLVLTAR